MGNQMSLNCYYPNTHYSITKDLETQVNSRALAQVNIAQGLIFPPE